MEPITTEQVRNRYLNQEKAVNIQESLKQQEKLREGGLEGIDIRSGAKSLGKDDFLKLLITQLSHQDPTQPVTDQQFIAQMAQFSSLEQMQNISTGISRMGERQAYGLVGKYVIGKDFTTGEMTGGIVKALFYDNAGQPFLKVGGRAVSLNDITLVGEPESFRRDVGGLGSQNSNVPAPQRPQLPSDADGNQVIRPPEMNQTPASSTTTGPAETQAPAEKASPTELDNADKVKNGSDGNTGPAEEKAAREPEDQGRNSHQVPLQKAESEKERKVEKVNFRIRAEIERNYGFTEKNSVQTFSV